MKKLILSLALVLLVGICSAFTGFRPVHNVAGVRRSLLNAIGNGAMQVKVEPFCKMTFVDHRGHSIRLHTDVMHASHTTITFIFETGEKLIIKFVTIRAGHFVAESARSRDPNIIFYPAHSSKFYGMVGAVMITSTKPTIAGNFSHLVSDDDEVHLTLVSGTFSF